MSKSTTPSGTTHVVNAEPEHIKAEINEAGTLELRLEGHLIIEVYNTDLRRIEIEEILTPEQ